MIFSRAGEYRCERTRSRTFAPCTPAPTWTDEVFGRRNALYGWIKDNSWSSSSVSFTLSDRDRLTPGKVRYTKISDEGDESAATVPIAEFKVRACQNG